MQIVYATDGSESALLGATFLTALPFSPESDIRIVAVALANETPEDVEPALDAACDALRASAARVTRYVREGNATEQILQQTESAPTDLVVVGMQGKSAVARFFLGSVAESVSRHARCSVLIAHPLKNALQTVVVGIDGSQGAQAAARFLATLPLPAECVIRLVATVCPDEAVQAARSLPSISNTLRTLSQQERADAAANLAKAEAHLSGAGRRVTTAIRTGNAATALLEEAEETKADLLVVGARGLTGFDRFLLGSVSERLLRHAPCSVLCVRTPANMSPAEEPSK